MNEESFTHEHEFPDELISAYLDDELSPVEKKRVEEQLMDSPDHRRLFEELKALRSSLQALPQETLGDDFAQRVLRRAEQELLTGDTAASAAAVEKPAKKSSVPRTVPRPAANSDDGRGTWRGLVWSAAAMAAAIALIVFSPLLTDQSPRGVAVHDPEGEPAARVAQQAKPNDAQIGIGAAQVADAEKSKSAKDAQITSYANQAGRQVGQEFREAHDGFAETESLNEREFKSQASREELQSLVGDESLAERRLNQPTAFGGLKELPGSGKGASAEGGAIAPGAPSAAYANPGPDAPPANNFAFDQAGGRWAANGQRAFARQRDGSAVPESGMLVVSVDVTADALASRFMDEILAKHEIQVELARAEVQRVADSRFADSLSDAADSAGDAEHRSNRELFKNAEQSGRSGDVELMYVVASVEQIDGLLEDLKGQSQQVLALAYDQPFSPEQGNDRAEEVQSLRQRTFQSIAPPVVTRADVLEKAEGDAGFAIADGAPQSQARGQSAAGKPDDADRKLQDDDEPARDGLAADKLLLDRAKADAKYAVDADSYRGIARRLHLPEDLRLALPPAKAAEDGAEAGQGAGGGNASPAAVNVGSLGGAASTAAIETGSLDALKPGVELNDALKGLGEKQAAHGEQKDFQQRASTIQQPSMRVLFVLRAVGRTSPLADQVPADQLPAAAASEAERE